MRNACKKGTKEERVGVVIKVAGSLRHFYRLLRAKQLSPFVARTFRSTLHALLLHQKLHFLINNPFPSFIDSLPLPTVVTPSEESIHTSLHFEAYTYIAIQDEDLAFLPLAVRVGDRVNCGKQLVWRSCQGRSVSIHPPFAFLPIGLPYPEQVLSREFLHNNWPRHKKLQLQLSLVHQRTIRWTWMRIFSCN